MAKDGESDVDAPADDRTISGSISPGPRYVCVRRPADGPFGVLPDDLVVEETPSGYDLSLMRSLATEGLARPLVVEPIPGGRFQVVDGLKRLAVIRVLIQNRKKVYDRLRGFTRPASKVFALIRCRLRRPPSEPGPH